jgi:hypothetical protein
VCSREGEWSVLNPGLGAFGGCSGAQILYNDNRSIVDIADRDIYGCSPRDGLRSSAYDDRVACALRYSHLQYITQTPILPSSREWCQWCHGRTIIHN